jgi:hypothetical protein
MLSAARERTRDGHLEGGQQRACAKRREISREAEDQRCADNDLDPWEKPREHSLVFTASDLVSGNGSDDRALAGADFDYPRTEQNRSDEELDRDRKDPHSLRHHRLRTPGASLLSCAPSQVGRITDSYGTVVGHPQGYRSRTRMNLKIVKKAFEMRSDGPPGDPEHHGDLLVFEAERDECHDLGLARGEERRRRRSVERRSTLRPAHGATLGSVHGYRIARIDHRRRTIKEALCALWDGQLSS